jgi:hypothetical protein
MKFYPSQSYILVEKFEQDQKGLELPEFVNKTTQTHGNIVVRVVEDFVPSRSFPKDWSLGGYDFFTQYGGFSSVSQYKYAKGSLIVVDIVGLEQFSHEGQLYTIVNEKYVKGTFYEEE